MGPPVGDRLGTLLRAAQEGDAAAYRVFLAATGGLIERIVRRGFPQLSREDTEDDRFGVRSCAVPLQPASVHALGEEK